MKLTNCNQDDIVFYQVQKNDDMNAILTKFNIKLNNLVRNNTSIELYEGEIIKIERNKGIQHIVKPMETLSAIAEKYNVSVDDIVAENKLNSKRLFIGQILNITKVKQN